MKKIKVFLGADHAGFALKEKIKKYLLNKGFEIADLSKEYKEGDDYPDYAFAVAKAVARNSGKGILA